MTAEWITVIAVGIAVLSAAVSFSAVRHVKRQIAEMAEALADIKDGNGNRRILPADRGNEQPSHDKPFP